MLHFFLLFFVIRIINTVISGSSAFLCGLIYISVTCLDEKYPHWNHGSKFRSMMILKCFLCGEFKKSFLIIFIFEEFFFSFEIFFWRKIIFFSTSKYLNQIDHSKCYFVWWLLGLVAVSAGCSVVDMSGALAIGVIAAILCTCICTAYLWICD